MAFRGNDYTGEVFGRLTVLGFAGYKGDGKSRARLWRCRCECGKETVVTQRNLVNGVTQSCGCMRGNKYTTT